MAETAKATKSRVPHVYIILLSIIVFSGLLTYVVPAGQFDRVKVGNVQRVDPLSYERIEQTPVNPYKWFVAIPQGFVSGASIIGMMLISVASIGIFTSTGALNRFFGNLAKSSGNKGKIAMMVGIMTYMYLHAGLTGAVNTPIGYTAVVVFIAVVCGYSKVTGLAMVAGSVMVGFGLGPTNPSTVLIAQEISELPLYSGMGYRVICWLVFLVATIIYMVVRAEKERKKREAGLLDSEDVDVSNISSGDDTQTVTTRDKAIIAALIISITSIIALTVKFSLNLQQMSGLYIIAAIVGGFIAGYTPREICVKMTEGAKSVMMGAIVVAMARAIPTILSQGNIIDTIIYHSASLLKDFPPAMNAMIMLFLQTIINFFISSGSGQAAAVMPIMAPLADMIGVSRQVAVLAYQMGDGFSNMIFPTSTSIMAYVAAGGVDYGKYLKYIVPFFCFMFSLGCIALAVATLIGYQ